MNAWVCIVALLAGAPLSLPVLDATGQATLETLDTALAENPAAARAFWGYVNFLDTSHELLAAEQALLEHRQMVSFRRAAGDFERFVFTHDEPCRAFDAYYETLANNTPLRQAEDTLWQAFLAGTPGQREGIFSLLPWMRARPHDALRWLETTPPWTAFSAEQRHAMLALRRDPPRRETFTRAFRAWVACPEHLNAPQQWWAIVAAANSEGQALRARYAPLLHRPTSFWVWHRHAVAWAAYPYARDWARADNYAAPDSVLEPGMRQAALRLLCRYPALRRHRLAQARETHGTLAWPPAQAPPSPAQWVWPETAASLSPPVLPSRPGKPVIERPGKPAMPGRPAMPEKPEKAPPASAEKPKPTTPKN